ncbi:MAG: hypothetical protein OWV35_07645 [Firmicutes bacterium]|nr:hypothetical protein [Bacillota bacterium]
MKRPVGTLLLLILVGARLLLAPERGAGTGTGGNWVRLDPRPARLVVSGGQPYLVPGPAGGALRLVPTAAVIRARPAPAASQLRPMPSGRGYWAVTVASGGRLLGPAAACPGHNLVAAAPRGGGSWWLDPGTGQVYPGRGVAPAPAPLPVRGVSRVQWAPDGHAAALVGQGTAGSGVYLWDGGGRLRLVRPLVGRAGVRGLGFTRDDGLLVAGADGRVWRQGRSLPLPGGEAAWVSRAADAAAVQRGQRLWVWQDGRRWQVGLARGWKLQGPVRFGRGQALAALVAGPDHRLRLLVAQGPSRWEVGLPARAQAEVLGWIGGHWVLVSTARGVYAWWSGQ